MSKTPLISIIVPAYNVEHYIEACLDSLLKQTYSNFEIIVIDDGSTDNTATVLQKFSHHQNIRLHHQVNSGISATRNQGLKLASGEFICFIDSDDYIAPNYLEALFAPFIQNPEIDITVCGYQEIHQTLTTKHQLQPKTLTGYAATKNFLINQQDFDILIWNKLYRKTLFTDHHILYPAGQIHEDNLTTYKLFSVARKICYIQDILYFYQRQNSQITKNLHSRAKTLKRLEAKEQMAIEARQFFHDDPNLQSASDVALILAYFAFLDHAISRHIDQKYFQLYRQRILSFFKTQDQNPFLTTKLKLYRFLIRSPKGIFYFIFRKITLKRYNIGKNT